MIWSEYKRRVKPFLSTFKSDYRKEAKQSVLLDSLNQWVTQIYGKNTDNMNKYTENMTKLVTLIKDTFKKDEVQSPAVTPGSRISKMTKPAKVPFWFKDISLETYTKHITT